MADQTRDQKIGCFSLLRAWFHVAVFSRNRIQSLKGGGIKAIVALLSRSQNAGTSLPDSRKRISLAQATAVLLVSLMAMPNAELVQVFARPTLPTAARAQQVVTSSGGTALAPSVAPAPGSLLLTESVPRRIARPSSAPAAASARVAEVTSLATAFARPELMTSAPASPGRLTVSTYLGGGGSELMRDFAGYANLDAAVDSKGNVYLVGGTSSANFPTTADAPGRQLAGQSDIFLVKLDSTGQQVLYATLIGGSGSESAAAMAVGEDGGIYLAGTTTSPDFFASTFSAAPRSEGNADSFILKLDPTGRTVVYATCLGGSAPDSARDLAIDSSGAVNSRRLDRFTKPADHDRCIPAGIRWRNGRFCGPPVATGLGPRVLDVSRRSG